MTAFLWLLAVPIVFLLPGLFFAKLTTGRNGGALTLLWSLFFSIVLLPPIAFGAAMLLDTNMNGPVVIGTALVLGIPGLVFRRNEKEAA